MKWNSSIMCRDVYLNCVDMGLEGHVRPMCMNCKEPMHAVHRVPKGATSLTLSILVNDPRKLPILPAIVIAAWCMI